MKRPAIFFDRDNTLIVSGGFLGDPAKVQLVGGAADAVARARALGYATVVVSNQSGVARGMFDESAVHSVNARLDELLAERNPAAVIDRHEFCPFHPQATVECYKADSDLRKPKPGMILSAAERLALDLSRSWVIGDAPRDIEAGRAAGCRTILFVDPALPVSPAAREPETVRPDYVCATLKEAMDYIERHPAPPSDEDPAPNTSATPQTTPAAPSPRAAAPDAGTASLAKLQAIAEQTLHELRRGNEHPHHDFSVSKLLAGIVQVIVLAVLFLAYLNRGSSGITNTLLLAIVLQALTISLLIMTRQK